MTDTAAPPDRAERELLSSMRSLLLLGKMMAESADEAQILLLAGGAAPSFAPCEFACVVLAGDREPGEHTELTGQVAAQLADLGPGEGAVTADGVAHAWAWPLRRARDHLGHLVVGGSAPLTGEQGFLLRALSQQTGDALVNRRLHDQEQATAAALATVNDRLRGTVEALQRSMDIHARLTAVAVSGEGQDGIARAVHDLTGLGVALEDRHGNLLAWAGPDRPVPYPKQPAAVRDRLLTRAAREARPLRDGPRVIALAHPRGDTLGAIVLHDPEHRAGEAEVMALEHGATILAMELARVRSLAESELRLRRDVVDELLSGADEAGLARAVALGYDLQRPHRVVVVEGDGREGDDDARFHAVRRSARETGAGTLVVARGDEVVLLADREPDWEHMRRAVRRDLGGARVRMGIGQRCEAVGDFARSYRQARLALRLAARAGWDDRAIRFDDLGVYQLLVGLEDLGEVDRFVRQWLGALLDYDATRGSDLVRTLAHHLERGGNYELTARSLIVHRNTLKYRLQRIRQIAGVDLHDPDVWFNLHLATRAWRTLEVLRAAR